ncbi:hypothetical protein LNKW23_28320 [Paralimibaculum aggregatum]|uniref:VOC domain-containing protein n=1 Tax=Paralimibaculum aggregatum TaxID=3036245 RepID=A0ABQ6LMT2_9RHOB|nr:VOC family protein [Limibaculum sp. NKW23]GMG83619.1 hypothetical protein LNKW23_28320 [Limibaculum sp. NKW23]
MAQQGEIGPAAPFFIVTDLSAALAHYVGGLGFACLVSAPDEAPFFAMVGRGAARLMLKQVAPDLRPVPNPSLHPWAPWDAFIFSAEPDDLAAEFAARGVALAGGPATRDDGLRGFEVADPDGHVLFFGRPV